MLFPGPDHPQPHGFVNESSATTASVDVNRLLHDLRNPLSAVHTAAAMIAEMDNGTPIRSVRPHLGLLLQAVEQLQKVIEQSQRKLDQASGD